MMRYWKTFAGHCIHNSNNIFVYQNPLYRWLRFENQAIQSMIHRRHPERPTLAYLMPFTLGLRSQPGSSCLLGLGGAAVAHVAKSTYPMLAVETNPQVIALASEYFMIQHIPHLSITQDDAFAFITETDQTYQHILVDIYSDAQFPQHCLNESFFTACMQHLLPKGILALNIADFQQALEIVRFIKKEHSTVCIPISGWSNMIILASSYPTDLIQMIRNHPALKTLFWNNLLGQIATMNMWV